MLGRSEKKSRARGRPPLDNDLLLGRRDTFVGVLESSWADIGWSLKKARSIRNVREALIPLRGYALAYPLDLFLEEAPVEASAPEMRAIRRGAWEAARAAREASEDYDKQLQLVNEAKAALAQAEGQPDTRKIVMAELEKRQQKQDRFATELKEASERRDALDRELHKTQAFIAQTELLKLVKSKRYVFTPRNLANAMAGLPYIGWRQSIKRCAKFPCQSAVSINYQVFELVAHVLRDRRPKSSRQTLELFRAELPKLGRKHKRACCNAPR